MTGPVNLADPQGVEVVHVKTAQQMFDEVDKRFDSCDVAVFTAAVSDYRPERVSPRKLKKGADDSALAELKLVANPDILATMGARKTRAQVVVGFAAETDDVEDNARVKLSRKNADLIVANDVSGGRGFGADDNRVMLVTPDEVEELPLMSKDNVAKAVLDAILRLI